MKIIVDLIFQIYLNKKRFFYPFNRFYSFKNMFIEKYTFEYDFEHGKNIIRKL